MKHFPYTCTSKRWSLCDVGTENKEFTDLSLQEITLGCALRIADALERMASNSSATVVLLKRIAANTQRRERAARKLRRKRAGGGK